MLFNSAEFILAFVPCTLGIWWWLQSRSKPHAAQWSLCALSMIFYSAWNWKYLPLLCGSVLVNFLIGRRINVTQSKPLLCAGVVLNLVLLGYFKYVDFFIGNINQLTGSVIPLLHVALPLGISFFTFQKIAFLVDCWRGKVKDTSFREFSVFVFFFPQLVAGPITHHADFIPQLSKKQKFDSEMFSRGMLLFFMGLVKKIWIADTLAKYIDPLYVQEVHLQFFEAWLAALGYSFQLFIDFSAYSEMAMGLGLLFGLKLPQNFNSPYKAQNIADFWRRWHMTLSAFLRDYLYIPLGGSRNGFVVGLMAAATTMLIGGFWHGANWTFLVWGGLHATFIIFFRLWQLQAFRLPSPLAMLLTFLAVVFAWVVFRSPSMHTAIMIWKGMVGLNGVTYPKLFVVMGLTSGAGSPHMTGLELLLLPILGYWVFSLPNSIEKCSVASPSNKSLLGLGMMMFLGIFWLNDAGTFLYWNF